MSGTKLACEKITEANDVSTSELVEKWICHRGYV